MRLWWWICPPLSPGEETIINLRAELCTWDFETLKLLSLTSLNLRVKINKTVTVNHCIATHSECLPTERTLTQLCQKNTALNENVHVFMSVYPSAFKDLHLDSKFVYEDLSLGLLIKDMRLECRLLQCDLDLFWMTSDLDLLHDMTWHASVKSNLLFSWIWRILQAHEAQLGVMCVTRQSLDLFKWLEPWA